MKTRSSTNTRKNNNFRYQPYSQNFKRSSFTNSQFLIWKKRIDNYVYDKTHLIQYMLPALVLDNHHQTIDDIVLGEFYQVYNLNQLYFNN